MWVVVRVAESGRSERLDWLWLWPGKWLEAKILQEVQGWEVVKLRDR